MNLGDMVAQYRTQNRGNYGGNVPQQQQVPTAQPMMRQPVQQPQFDQGMLAQLLQQQGGIEQFTPRYNIGQNWF